MNWILRLLGIKKEYFISYQLYKNGNQTDAGYIFIKLQGIDLDEIKKQILLKAQKKDGYDFHNIIITSITKL